MVKARFFLFSFLYWLGALAILVLVYPPGDPIRLGLMTIRDAVAIYLEMSILIGFAGSALIAIPARLNNRCLRSAIAFITAAILLGTYGMVVGTASVEVFERVPLETMNGYFLRELNAIKFGYVVAPLCGGLLGIWAWWQGHSGGGLS